MLGWDGLLTSSSTRIDGLVSVADVATGRLRAVPADDPVAALERLDERIERNDSRRLPLTLLLAAVVLVLAFVRPVLALRAILVALAANLWLEPVLAVAAGVAAVVLPLGLSCTAILAAYLLSLGLDAETVALSPLGPSQSGRFYGINNLLETLLLVPSFVGAALLGSGGVAVAVLALVTVGGNRFGADGGGLVVLLVGYAVLAVRLRGLAPDARADRRARGGRGRARARPRRRRRRDGRRQPRHGRARRRPRRARRRPRRPARALRPPHRRERRRSRRRPRRARGARGGGRPPAALTGHGRPARGDLGVARSQRHAVGHRRRGRRRSGRGRPRRAGGVRESQAHTPGDGD